MSVMYVLRCIKNIDTAKVSHARVVKEMELTLIFVVF